MRRTAFDAFEQLGTAAGVAFAAADGSDAIVLDGGEQLRPALLAQDLADERAEGMNVLAQRFVPGREMDLTADHGGRDCTQFPRRRRLARATPSGLLFL